MRISIYISIICLALVGCGVDTSDAEIVFHSSEDGNVDIYVMRADGSGRRRLTRNSALDRAPKWSPDGDQIAFESDRDGNTEIYVMNANGTGQRNFSRNPADEYSPDWSPDGKWIAFVSDRDGDLEIFIQEVEGSRIIQLTHNDHWDFSPSWSPDGNKLAFSSGITFDDRDIFIMNADGSEIDNITKGYGESVSPDWSPDGQWIAFASNAVSSYEIYKVRVDGTDMRRLTNDDDSLIWLGNLMWDWMAVWSPDGKQIMFSSDREERNEIFIINADGTGLTRITWGEANNYSPDWRP